MRCKLESLKAMNILSFKWSYFVFAFQLTFFSCFFEKEFATVFTTFNSKAAIAVSPVTPSSVRTIGKTFAVRPKYTKNAPTTPAIMPTIFGRFYINDFT